MLAPILLLLALLATLAYVRLFAGVPRPAHPSALLPDRELAFLEAAAETLVPADCGGLARGGTSAELGLFVDRYVGALPVPQRRLIRLMLVFFEHATLLFPARGRGGHRRFSSLDAAQRRRVLEGWASSPWAWRRSLFTALRAFVVMGVLGHRDNLRALGLAPWEIESPVIEADLLYPPVGESRASITLSEADLTPSRDATPLRGGAEDRA